MNVWATIAMWLTDKIKIMSDKMTTLPSDNLYPPLDAKVDALLIAAKSKGMDVGLYCAYRSYKEQDALYAKGRQSKGKVITNARGGYSYHNFGIAVDIVFRVNGKWSWDPSLPWVKLGTLGKSLGLEWGGDWTGLKDLVHFQWPIKLTLAELRALYDKGGLVTVWKSIE